MDTSRAHVHVCHDADRFVLAVRHLLSRPPVSAYDCLLYIVIAHVTVLYAQSGQTILLQCFHAGHHEVCPTCKKSIDEVLALLSAWSEKQLICIWSS